MSDAREIKGQVIRRGEPGYAAALDSTRFNGREVARFPDVIVRARDADDVAAAVRMAKSAGLKIGVRSGGHNWAANHVRDGGMVLDVSALNTVAIDERAMTATAGPGVQGAALLLALTRKNLFFPAGHCEGVCLGGYLLQGGFGWHSRALGPACESVIGIDYVDADGQLRHADANENSDMYWAARGSGLGFFGVVTRFHLRLYRKPKVVAAKFAAYPLRHAEDVFRWAHKVGPEIPTSIEMNILMSRHIPFLRGPGFHVAAPVFEDDWASARRAVGFMKSRPKGAAYVTPLLPVRLSWMYKGVMAHYPHNNSYAVDNMWTRAPIDDLMPGLKRIVETLPPAPSHMLWMNWAPPARRPDMAYSLEDNIYIALYGVWNDRKLDGVNKDWARSNMHAMSAMSTGIQLADENLGERAAPFLAPANLARLDALRAKHDPQGRFHSYMGRP
jgi:FAD/FMN-containing dehydrogenase